MAFFSGPTIPNITKLSSRIIRILGCNPSPMTLQGTNTYLIGCGQNRILLDTGDVDKKEYIENLRKVLNDEKAVIDKIILTHWHHDHIGGVKDILGFAKNDVSVWKFPRTDAADIYEELPSSIQLNELKNNQEFCVDGATIKILHSPGHTTDHVVALLKEENALFSGDCILGEGTAVFEDLHDYMNSLKTILDSNPNIIYPAHGNIINDPSPKIQYYIDHRNLRETQILEVLKKSPHCNFTEMDIVAIIYKETPKELHMAAAYNVNHHLKKLVKDQLIVESEHEDGKVTWEIRDKNAML